MDVPMVTAGLLYLKGRGAEGRVLRVPKRYLHDMGVNGR
jgi:hypothetical protein